LVVTLRMFRILALNSLVNAYSHSALAYEGIKISDFQALSSGILIALCFFFISRSSPLPRLAPERPPTRVFSPGLLLSVGAQFVIHLYCLLTTLSLVYDYEPTPADAIDLSSPFRPSLLNTVVFLLTSLQQVVTFAANYRGHPWMTGLLENTPMYRVLSGLTILTFWCTLELSPGLNQWLELVKLPNEQFKWKFAGLLLFNFVGALGVEFLIDFIFRTRPKAPRTIHRISYQHITSPSTESSDMKEVVE